MIYRTLIPFNMICQWLVPGRAPVSVNPGDVFGFQTRSALAAVSLHASEVALTVTLNLREAFKPKVYYHSLYKPFQSLARN